MQTNHDYHKAMARSGRLRAHGWRTVGRAMAGRWPGVGDPAAVRSIKAHQLRQRRSGSQADRDIIGPGASIAASGSRVVMDIETVDTVVAPNVPAESPRVAIITEPGASIAASGSRAVMDIKTVDTEGNTVIAIGVAKETARDRKNRLARERRAAAKGGV